MFFLFLHSVAAVAVGKERFSDVDYSGIMWVEDIYDDDYLGFVFSYQDSSNFYVCYSPKDGNPGNRQVKHLFSVVNTRGQ